MLGKILPVKFTMRLSSEQDEAEPVEAKVESGESRSERRLYGVNFSGGQDV
jgi:hypothetical protein